MYSKKKLMQNGLVYLVMQHKITFKPEFSGHNKNYEHIQIGLRLFKYLQQNKTNK